MTGREEQQVYKGGRVLIACYDADFLPYYVSHNKKDQPIKTLDDCKDSCDQFVRNINKVIKPDIYCGFITEGKCFRYQINPEYKSNRRYDSPPEHLYAVKQYLKDEYLFRGMEGYEADDLVVSFKRGNPDYDVVIVSPDKDILGSVDVAFNPRKMEWVYNDDEAIVNHFWRSMITGDPADGVKGIPGKGEKAADSIIRWSEKYSEKVYKTVLEAYIEYFGEYEGIKQYHKNYLSLKLVNDVTLENVKLHMINKEDSE
jgi:5'-3' exonuclease